MWIIVPYGQTDLAARVVDVALSPGFAEDIWIAIRPGLHSVAASVTVEPATFSHVAPAAAQRDGVQRRQGRPQAGPDVR
jgi:hypothetical protein